MTDRSTPAIRPAGRPRNVAPVERAPRTHSVSLADLAYERLEEMIVTCTLAPGAHLSIQELQERTQMGRTPIHQAVNRLASDTLILVRPRHGLQIAPVDLARERTLLQLRREMERFVVRLAAERSGASHRNQFLHIAGLLRDDADGMTTAEFNQLDRRIDHLLIAAAGESFLEHTLRPLHTIFRRIGWIYHSRVRPDEGVSRTIDCHLAILDAVAANQVDAAVTASDRLVEFSSSMFDVLGAGVDPALFDCNLALLATGRIGRPAQIQSGVPS
jgi:DNA-binding GntR family transcriptional regulator